DHPLRKLDDKCFGPFKIVHKGMHSTYELKLPDTWKGVYPIYNKIYLTKAHTPSFPNQQPPPPPPAVEVDGEPEYEVEEILSSQYFRKHLQYLVKWEGYSKDENI